MKILNKKCIFNDKGFTLIELIIVMALIGIIAGMAFSMNLFGIRVFAKGSDIYDLNTEVNIASEYITKYIRYSYGIEILDGSAAIPESTAIAASANPNTAYLFVESASGKDLIRYRDKNDTRTLGEFDSCTLSVTPKESDKALSYSISASYKSEDYLVDSGIVPVNLLFQSTPKIIDNTGAADGAPINITGDIAIKIMNNSPAAPSAGKLTFNPTNPPDGTVDTAYSAPGYQLTANGGTPNYTFTASNINARLPYGMTLSSDGKLSGTPKEWGTFTVGVVAFDSSTPYKTATGFFDITIVNNVTVNVNAPEITNVKITGPTTINTDGTAAAGSTLTVNYDYYDAEGEPESGSIYTWYSGNSVNGTDMAVITGAASKTFVPNDSYVNKYIFVKVTPKSTDTSEGAGAAVYCLFPVRITAGGAVIKPIAQNVEVGGNAKVGAKLTGTYEYIGGTEGVSEYQWYRAENSSGKNIKAIPGAILNEYTVTSDDYHMYLCFEVTPKSSDGVYGNTVRSVYTNKIQN